jgi:hypothetical protein
MEQLTVFGRKSRNQALSIPAYRTLGQCRCCGLSYQVRRVVSFWFIFRMLIVWQ